MPPHVWNRVKRIFENIAPLTIKTDKVLTCLVRWSLFWHRGVLNFLKFICFSQKYSIFNCPVLFLDQLQFRLSHLNILTQPLLKLEYQNNHSIELNTDTDNVKNNWIQIQKMLKIIVLRNICCKFCETNGKEKRIHR